ncbi:MAG TPA: 3-dehydroquinate synthase [Candidatus Angelobacter sp.]|nr:3-dehydroquinate synthase [Candidatus Angelobacter sp.]
MNNQPSQQVQSFHALFRSPDEPITRFFCIIVTVRKIKVKLGHNSYDVLIADGLLRDAGRFLANAMPSRNSQVFVVTSPNVRRHWGNKLEASLRRAKLAYYMLEANDGEPAKNAATVEHLAEQMVAAGADRKALVVAFGGGVIGDAAGFLASIFMRGVPVVQIPTTVVAQLDASIGGKTGVNLRSGKNLIGTFHQPRMVFVDPQILSTLEEREFRSGLFEALKCGVIRDRKLFEFMEQTPEKIRNRNRKALESIIVDSVRVKAQVVSADERESGLRAILNFGHTIGHALEAATGYSQLLHGEAVGWGMIAASAIASEVHSCTPSVSAQITSAVRSYGPLPHFKAGADDIIAKLSADKKRVGGAVHFVLPQKIGRVKITSEVPPEAIYNAVEQIRNYA